MRRNTPSVEGRQEAWEDMIAEERKLLLNKGADYTAGQKDADAYANFRIIADLLKGAPITSYTVAMIYALKHVLSLITFTKTGKQESGEGLRGRHMDARNYFFILNELVPDHVNSFAAVDDSDWWTDEANGLFNEAVEETAALEEALTDKEFPTILKEPAALAEYFDRDDMQWHPISDLDKGKEVNDNTTLNGRLDACNCCLECCGTPLVQIGDLRGRK